MGLWHTNGSPNLGQMARRPDLIIITKKMRICKIVDFAVPADHPNYNIIEIGQNTEKSPGDLRRLAVTRTPLKDNQLTLMWKTLKQ